MVNSNGTNGHADDGGGYLDLRQESHRGAVRVGMTRWPKRWRGITERRKDEFAAQLEEAGAAAREALTSQDPDIRLDAAKTLASIVKTAVMMEGQNQKDDHLYEDYDRAADGQARRLDVVEINMRIPTTDRLDTRDRLDPPP